MGRRNSSYELHCELTKAAPGPTATEERVAMAMVAIFMTTTGRDLEYKYIVVLAVARMILCHQESALKRTVVDIKAILT